MVPIGCFGSPVKPAIFCDEACTSTIGIFIWSNVFLKRILHDAPQSMRTLLTMAGPIPAEMTKGSRVGASTPEESLALKIISSLKVFYCFRGVVSSKTKTSSSAGAYFKALVYLSISPQLLPAG